jgi:mRNA interferase RelE/StbE
VTAGPWRVELSSRAQRDLGRLPDKVALAVAEFVTVTLPENPHRLTEELRGQLAGLRSARRGDYRVLVQLVEDDRVVLVVAVDHRAHVYRPR